MDRAAAHFTRRSFAGLHDCSYLYQIFKTATWRCCLSWKLFAARRSAFFFFFRGSGIVFPLPNTVYIFETHVILWKTLLPDVLSDAISSKIRFRNPFLSYIDKEEEEILVFSNRNSSTFLRIENYNIRYLWEREREYNRKLLTRFVEDAIYAERETLFETRRENYALNAHFTHRVEIFDSTRFINHRTERNESVKVYG